MRKMRQRQIAVRSSQLPLPTTNHTNTQAGIMQSLSLLLLLPCCKHSLPSAA